MTGGPGLPYVTLVPPYVTLTNYSLYITAVKDRVPVCWWELDLWDPSLWLITDTDASNS